MCIVHVHVHDVIYMYMYNAYSSSHYLMYMYMYVCLLTSIVHIQANLTAYEMKYLIFVLSALYPIGVNI